MFAIKDNFIKRLSFAHNTNTEEINNESEVNINAEDAKNIDENFLGSLSVAIHKEKIQKPNFDTKIGRQLLASYLLSKFKQVALYDKKSQKPLFLEVKPDFLKPLAQHIINNHTKRIMIAITGESASGKTTICNKIRESIEEMRLPVTIFSCDNYFNDISELIKKYGSFDNLRDMGYDVDSPENFQMDILRDDLIKLSNGEDIMSPKYLVNGTGVNVPKSIPVKSNKIVVVEGMSSMYKDLPDMFDIRVYVQVPEEERKRRFMKRASERNQNAECAKRHWNYIKGAGEKYVKPVKDRCDVVVSGDIDLSYLSDILKYLRLITNNFQE